MFSMVSVVYAGVTVTAMLILLSGLYLHKADCLSKAKRLKRDEYLRKHKRIIKKEYEILRIDLSWSQGITVLKSQLLQKLVAKGYSLDESFYLLSDHQFKYSFMLDCLFIEILKDAALTGIYCNCIRTEDVEKLKTERALISSVNSDPKVISTTVIVHSFTGNRTHSITQ